MDELERAHFDRIAGPPRRPRRRSPRRPGSAPRAGGVLRRAGRRRASALGKPRRFGFVRFASEDARVRWCRRRRRPPCARSPPPSARARPPRKRAARGGRGRGARARGGGADVSGADVALLVHASHAGRVVDEAEPAYAARGVAVACAARSAPAVGRKKLMELGCCAAPRPTARAPPTRPPRRARTRRGGGRAAEALIADDFIAFITMPIALLRGAAAGPHASLRAAAEALHAAALASPLLAAPPPGRAPRWLHTVPPRLAAPVADVLDGAARGRYARSAARRRTTRSARS